MSKDRKKEGSLRFYQPKFKYIFCDMDGEIIPTAILVLINFSTIANAFVTLMLGTLLNSKSQVSWTNARALKEALSRGVKIVIATGKVRTEGTFCSHSNSLTIGMLFKKFSIVSCLYLAS